MSQGVNSKHSEPTSDGIRRFPRTRNYVSPQVGSSPQGSNDDISDLSKLTWERVPRFDPDRVPKTQWMIEDFLAEGSVQLIFGEPGAFKSSMCLFAARSISKGDSFLGMATRKSRVLVLDYENPANIIRGRCKDIGLHLPKNRNLAIWNRFTSGIVPRPQDDALVDLVHSCVREEGHRLWIIFDSWSSLLREGDGGEMTGQIAPIYAAIRRLTDLGATCTVLDHTRKDDPHTLYGGLDKIAKCDSYHNLILHPNPSMPGNPIIQVDSWLKRFSPRGDGSFAFEVVSRQSEKGGWHLSELLRAKNPEEVALARKRDRLLQLIRDNPNNSQKELAALASETAEMGRDEAIDILREGVKTGHWTRIRMKHGLFRYSLK
jgi:KaiC/GvpD/RAD55 family RecA-like ATPase